MAPEAPQGRGSRKKATGGESRAAAPKDGKKAGKDRKRPSRREGGNKALILALMQRPKGATLQELTAATGWQAHSVRGFLSAVLRKQMLTVESSKPEHGERPYRIAASK